MPTVAIKIEHFKSEIMNDVADKRKIIEKHVYDKLEKDYKEKEFRFLEEAYEIIQTGLKNIDKEKNEVISKAQMENKVRLLAKRKEIIDTVFKKAKEKIAEYTKTKEYNKQLILDIHKHMELLGEGEYVIYLNHQDKELYKDVKNQFKDSKVVFERKYIEMLGGCKLHNTTKNTYLDDSIAKRLEQEEDDFLQYCGIDIEKVGD